MSAKFDLMTVLDSVKNGDEMAMGQLLEYFKPLIESKVAEYSSVLEDEETRQLASIALYEAAKSYSPRRADSKVTFGLYAKICIRNRLISETRKIQPAFEPIEDHDLSDGSSLEDEVLGKDSIAHTMSVVRKSLTPYEEKVLLLYLEGNRYTDIARSLGKDEKSVANAMSRVRRKLKYLL